MNSSGIEIKAISLSSIGFALFFAQIPLVLMVLNSSGAMEFPDWDAITLGILAGSFFFVIPVFIFFIFYFTSKISSNFFYITLIACTSYLLVKQLDYFVFRHAEISLIIRTGIFLFLAAVFFIVFWKIKRNLLIVFSTISILSPILLIFFVSLAYPSHDENANFEKSNSDIEINSIVLLTFEKLVPSLLMSENGVIFPKYPNLKRLAEISDVYTNAHANSSSTSISLASLYSGLNYYERKNKLTYQTIINDLEKDRAVYLINDYMKNRFCNPERHVCVQSLGDVSHSRRTRFLLAWFEKYLKTILPHSFMRQYMGLFAIETFADLYSLETEKSHSLYAYPLRQFSNLLKLIISQGAKKSLFIMHSFLTDGASYKSEKTGKLKDKKPLPKKLARLKLFDQKIGELIKNMKDLGSLEKSLIMITSDTGSDEFVWNKLRTGPEKKVLATQETTRVFKLIHWPNQKSPGINSNKMQHTDVRGEILARIRGEKRSSKINTKIKITTHSDRGMRVFELTKDGKWLIKTQGF